MNDNQFDKAIEVYKELNSISQDENTTFNLEKALKNNGNLEEAIEYMQQLLSTDEQHCLLDVEN